MKTLKRSIKELQIKGTINLLNLKNKLMEQDGFAGEYAVLTVVGIILALVVCGILLTFFKTEIKTWIDTLKAKVDGFFSNI